MVGCEQGRLEVWRPIGDRRVLQFASIAMLREVDNDIWDHADLWAELRAQFDGVLFVDMKRLMVGSEPA